MYEPTTGRFNRLDDFAGDAFDPQSYHKYAYVHGDPVNGIDPSGEFLVSLGIGIINSTFLRNSDTKLSLSVKAAATHSIYRAAFVAMLRIYDVMFATLSLGSVAGSLGFWAKQGPLSGKIAAMYSARGVLGSTILGQVYTQISDGGYAVTDDGSMLDAIYGSGKHGQNWLIQTAQSQGAQVGSWSTIRIKDFVDTGEQPNLVQNFWVGGLHRLEAQGTYEIKLLSGTTAKVRKVQIHWVGTDRADARPSAELDNPALYAAESAVGVVGDGLLGADFTFFVNALENRTQERDIGF
jgi:hypothetical protein